MTIRTASNSAVEDFAIQSTPKHVGLIMDGNRRWAKARRLPVAAGHRAGLQRLVDLLPAFRESGVETLTAFAFSSANWQRSNGEVGHLMKLAEEAVGRFTPICIEENIRVEVIGRMDRLPAALRSGIRNVERKTIGGSRRLRIALDYSSREAIVNAAKKLARTGCDIESFSEVLGDAGSIDLLIRTGKEQRLSDFMLWECAFAELYFPDLYWPEFDGRALDDALAAYRQRNRRFGT